MKTELDSKGRTIGIPETPEEKMALEHLSTHRPLFAVAESYMVSSFIEGYQKGVKDTTKKLQHIELCQNSLQKTT